MQETEKVNLVFLRMTKFPKKSCEGHDNPGYISMPDKREIRISTADKRGGNPGKRFRYFLPPLPIQKQNGNKRLRGNSRFSGNSVYLPSPPVVS